MRKDRQMLKSWYEDRFLLTLMIAIFLHTLLLLGVHFSHEVAQASHSLEVTLVTHRDDTSPDNPDFLAQANQTGSGSLTEKAEVSTTQLADFNDNEIHHIQTQSLSLPQPTEITPSVITTRQTTLASTEPPIPFLPPEKEATDATTNNTDNIEQRALEIASLQAQLKAKQQAYAKRPRKQQITAVTAKEDPAALYLNTWRAQIERVGNQNYTNLNIDNLYGSLRLLVSINANGSINEVQLLKSSGNDHLDQAAIKIVRQAAPFPPFTSEIKKTTDILEIIRTWKFEPGRYSF